VRVRSVDDLQIERRTGYRYEVDLENAIKEAKARFKLTLEALRNNSVPPATRPRRFVTDSRIRRITSDLDSEGRWVNRQIPAKIGGKDGVAESVSDSSVRISSRVFVNNLNALCDYLEQTK
jgi:hypothetical protein